MIGSGLQGDTARFGATFKKGNQSIVIITLVNKAESRFPAICVLYHGDVYTLCKVDRNPGAGCDRICLASHRQCPPKVLEQPQDVVPGDGWLPFRMYYGPEFTGKAMFTWAYRNNVALRLIEPGKTKSERVRGIV